MEIKVGAGKNAMISQPMAGKSDEEIISTREAAKEYLESLGYRFVNTLFDNDFYSAETMEAAGVKHVQLRYLAESLKNMSRCDAAYFCKGWDSARGCLIEHRVAQEYGVDILYEE